MLKNMKNKQKEWHPATKTLKDKLGRGVASWEEAKISWEEA
jgi:hypothetical protein